MLKIKAIEKYLDEITLKQIAEALEKHDTFYLRWVDLFETIYDISDADYTEYLSTRAYVYDVCINLANRFRLKRLDLNDGRNYGTGQTIEYIETIIDDMAVRGLLVLAERNGNKLVRGINKTEQKKLKINVA